MTDEEIRRIIAKHYKGKEGSLLAQKIFAVAREVSDLTEIEMHSIFEKRDEEMELLEDTVRALRGLPPIAR